MKSKTILIALVLFLLLALTNSQNSGPASAQSGSGYELRWYSIDGGVATFTSGGMDVLSGTIGQADAGTLSGGAYTLIGGFWVDFLGNRLYLPSIRR